MTLPLLLTSFMLAYSSVTMIMSSTTLSISFPFMKMLSSEFQLSMIADWMSCMFLSIILFISSMILIYSMSYIPKKEHKMFSSMMLMFVLSMNMLVMSDNIIFILLGWDGLGLSSYILVVYYQNYSSAASGSITIITNRMGDICILLSIAMMFNSMNWNFHMNKEIMTISLMLITMAAFSKSAQFPLSAWLPAAMAAPTPISALVHSSTLVTAGVFILIRMMDTPHPKSMFLIMMMSSFTAIYASMSANWEQDMKKIIALSTLSQIAMMMFSLSMNLYNMAFFHLITHALFKSTMFMCAGSMIHNFSYQDMRHMGSVQSSTPTNSTAMGISSMALMGIPFMSGFMSKDPIIENMIYSKMNLMMSLMMILSVGMTATYTMRMNLKSMKFSMLSKPDISIHSFNYMNNPLIIMLPTSISMGTIMMWITNPEQMFIIPTQMKMMILLSLFMGLITGVSLSFKKKSFIMLGEASISLWFTHYLSSLPTKNMNPMMMLFSKNDNSWQEIYGPQESFKQILNSSTQQEKSKKNMMFHFMIITILPMILLI